MNIIALWAVIERDLAGLITNFIPGKAAPIAKLFFQRDADGPKVAIRSALAEAMLPESERAIFDGLMRRHETQFKHRNKLAHWTLATCTQLPDVIVAIDPRDAVRITAESDEVTDALILELDAKENSHLPAIQRISQQTALKIADVFLKHVDKMYAYKIPDLETIERGLEGHMKQLRRFRVLLRLRALKLTAKYEQELTQLSQELGLPPPKAEIV